MQASLPSCNKPKLLANSEQKASAGADPDLPRRFGRLTLLKHIARGGMGEVYLAASGDIDGAERPCVVKIIRREHAEDRSFLARFFDEARIQAQLHHPGIAQIYEAATDPSGKPYVVLEHVEGRNLGEVRHRVSQPEARVLWPEAVALGVAVTDALAHVHECTDAMGRPLEIVHRDLSPQNVMVSYGGEVKLIDFGTARGENRRCHTVAGIVFAKPGYVAPEVANNQPGGAAADLYAVGIMLWELLGRRRFLTGEPAEHLAKVAAGERQPTPLAPGVDAPAELDRIIGRLTEYDIASRYGSARDAMNDLVALLKAAPSTGDGERSVRSRVAQLMQRLYPAEPARSRIDFARLVALTHKLQPRPERTTPTPKPANESADQDSVLPGTRYQLSSELGRGGMGMVVEGRHLDLGRSVAIKLLSPDSSRSAELFERFRDEARAIAQIRHENLVTLYDFGVAADGRPFYVMELLEGETLAHYLAREKGMDWREAVALGVQACCALEAAHAAGVVHRDIKPHNLFITTSGRLKLLDFGIAKPIKPGAAAEGDAEAIRVFGTPEYMAPEQESGEADARSDLYSLGCVLYELLTGTLPYSNQSPIGLIEDKKTSDPQPARHRAKDRGIPPMLDKTIQRSISRDPAHRFQSAGELRGELEAALREPIERRQRRRRVGLAMLTTALLTGTGVVGYCITNADAQEQAMTAIQPVLDGVQRLRGATPASETAAGTSTPVADESTAASAPVTSGDTSAVTSSGTPAEAVAANEANAAEDGVDEEIDGDDSAADPGLEDEPPVDDDDAELAAPLPRDPSAVPTPNADPATAVGSDQVGQEVAEAQQLLEGNRKLKAYNTLRRLGRQHPDDVRVLEAWSKAAVATRSWGEAYKVAWRWAEIDPNEPAQLHLARMQKRLGKRSEAITTLRGILAKNPNSDEARTMLGDISPRALLAMSKQ